MTNNSQHPTGDDQCSERLIELFEQASMIEPARREAFLAEACGGDDAMRRELESLLGYANDSASALPSSAIKLAARQLAGAARRDWAGQQVSHYRILRLLGTGGMGEVWLAEDARLNRQVAIKFLTANLVSNDALLHRFEQEARAASALNHPNILIVHEIGQHEEDHFIVTEFIEGETLRQRLAKSRLTIKETIDIAAQVASALRAARSAGIFHRDIKPENIMLREDGVVKVLDFGIAKLGRGDLETGGRGEAESEISPSPSLPVAPSLTSAGVILGTASYMSPEQARGETVDERSDLFSLGALMYEMAMGERLFAGAAPAEVTQQLLRPQEPLHSATKFSNKAKPLEPIIRKCLRRRREQRYASAAELLGELQRLKRQLETRFIRRMIIAVSLVALLAMVAIGWGIPASIHEEWIETRMHDGHTAGVRRAIFSPNGERLVSVSEDGEVRVWDFGRRELIKSFKGHTGCIYAATFAPDGKVFATAGHDQVVIVWNAMTLEPVTTLSEQRAPITGLAFSPDGQYLAAASDKPDARTVLWDAKRWERAGELPIRGADWGALLFTPGKPQLLIGQPSQTYDVVTKRRVNGLVQGLPSGASFSPNGSQLVTVGSSGEVNFIDFARQKLTGTHLIHRDNGRAVAFSPNGKFVATGSEDIILWNAATQELILRWDYSSYVWSLAWSPDGRYLVSTHGDGSILLWDVIARERAANLNQHSLSVVAVAISPDGKSIASGSEDRSVLIWNAASGRKEAVLLGHQSHVNAVAFSPDGEWLVSNSRNGELIRWNLSERRPRWRIQVYGSSQRLPISPDGRWIAASDGVYESATGQRVFSFGQDIWFASSAFSADGQRLAAVGGKLLYVWETNRWQVLGRRETGDETTVSISPNGQRLATGNINGELTLWQAAPLQPIGLLGRHQARAKQVAFSHDGRQLVSVGDDSKIKLWDAGSRKLLKEIGTHTAPVLAVTFSSDGRQIVAGEQDKSVRIYTRQRSLWGKKLDESGWLLRLFG